MPQAGSYVIQATGDNIAVCYIYSVPNTAPTDKTKYIKLQENNNYGYLFDKVFKGPGITDGFFNVPAGKEGYYFLTCGY